MFSKPRRRAAAEHAVPYRVWRPALVWAGLLGSVRQLGPHWYAATWADWTGLEWSKEFTTEPDAVLSVSRAVAGGPGFHNLRHSYAT